ncbi:hypothetical protein E2C01_055106 [Portunus trituberculatus]|uniref:Uncharacterized protein n=1 Tax=Portunus trituberculatus TaxID=210409 RepID=A0A5B7GTU2_PORTR|nr:hypothetical protein [Portunus trituberculatus]
MSGGRDGGARNFPLILHGIFGRRFLVLRQARTGH